MRTALPTLLLAVLAGACGSDAPAPGLPADAGLARDGGASLDAGAFPGDASAWSDGGQPSSDAGALQDLCNPVTQSCDAAEKCVVEGAEPGTRCIPDDGGAALGQPCEARRCERGLACARLTPEAVAACVRVCELGSGTGCEDLIPEHECRTRLTGTHWGACVELPPACDPYTQDPCGTAQACQIFVRRSGTREFRCQAAGSAAEGEVCGAHLEPCARGLTCVADRAGNAVCRRFCQTNDDCPDMVQCRGAVEDPPFRFCLP